MSKCSKRNEDIVAKFRSGMTLEAIGQEYGVSRQRVQQIIQMYGLSRDSGGVSANRSNKLEMIADLCRKGRTVTEIAQETACKHTFVTKSLKQLGLKARTPAQRKYGDESAIISFASRSQSLRDMAKLMGVNEHSLGRYLNRHYPEILKRISKRPTSEESEQRKLMVKQMLAEGKAPKEIAQDLKLNLPTLKAWMKYNHVS
ncbi:hypothetical protein [Bdellovibrio sp. BCCA]|uniref:hypothetical protein n=1 Tax=Bdellovibrio sp. BCCA TaxID=3136281 RepID=UPI0030F164DA